MNEKKTYETCPGCGSIMEEQHNETPDPTLVECPNPNCDWFVDE